jgi:hypothetical protein
MAVPMAVKVVVTFSPAFRGTGFVPGEGRKVAALLLTAIEYGLVIIGAIAAVGTQLGALPGERREPRPRCPPLARAKTACR